MEFYKSPNETSINNSSFASSEVKGVKTVFLAYFFKQQDIRLNSLTPLTPLTS